MKTNNDWERYQKGVDYNNSLEPSFYTLCSANWDFKMGFQWRGANLSDDYPQPVFNNINKFATFFVAYIMSTKPTISYESAVSLEDDDESDSILNDSYKEFEERVQLIHKTKLALMDGVVTGDYIGHFRMTTDKPYDGAYSDVIGQVDFDLIDAVNFYVANPNINEIQKQKYIQISGRSFISELNEEREEMSYIESDDDTENQIGKFGKIEMGILLDDNGKQDGKATWVLTYKKERDEEGIDHVYASKYTKSGPVYKDKPLGINLYPVNHGNWEEQKNTYHGMSFVQGVIPAQIFINRGFAMAMKHTIDTAFAKFYYDESVITRISNDVGTQTAVKLRPGQSINDIGGYMQPGDMSSQVMQMIDMSNQYMKDVAGITDALIGAVNPEQASGVSIAASTKQAGIPIENPKENVYTWLEDGARIYKNMVTNLYGARPVIVTREETTELVDFDFSSLKGMYKMPKVNVGPSSYWSEFATIQTLDNLLDKGLLEFVDYLEEMPKGYIKGQDRLIKKLKDKAEELPQDFRTRMTPEQQMEFDSLTPEEQMEIERQFTEQSA